MIYKKKRKGIIYFVSILQISLCFSHIAMIHIIIELRKNFEKNFRENEYFYFQNYFSEKMQKS